MHFNEARTVAHMLNIHFGETMDATPLDAGCGRKHYVLLCDGLGASTEVRNPETAVLYIAGHEVPPLKLSPQQEVIEACCKAEAGNGSDVVLVELIARVRADLEGDEYDGLEVGDTNGSCLKAYYCVHGYEGEIASDIINKIEFCSR